MWSIHYQLSKAANIIYFLLMLLLFCSTIYAQQTYNLQVIWERGVVDSLYYYYGFDLGSGDFNGDGFSDIVIQSALLPYPGIDRAEIFYGGLQFDTIPDIIIQSDTSWGFIRTKGIGDINGDGFDDLGLGSQLGVPAAYGSVYIYLGGNPMDTICDYHIVGEGGSFGQAVGSGDVNGDGYSDLIVGAYLARVNGGHIGPGRVYIYFGGPNFNTIPDVILNGGHCNDLEGFGSTVAGGGDVNGDGISDVIVGAGNFGNIIQGRIYIYFGGNPMDTSYDVAMSGEGTWHQLGFFGLDFLTNRTDYDHAMASTPFGGFGYERGKIYVLFGRPNMDSIPDVSIVGRFDTCGLGMSICNAGFTSRIDASDLFAGAPWEYGYRGSAYFWLGWNLLDTIPDGFLRGMNENDVVGYVVAGAGDVDGDGKDEIMVSNYPTMGESAHMRVWVCKYTSVGIEERLTPNAKRLTLQVSPNPVRSLLSISCPFVVKEMKIYDISGKIVKEIASPSTRNDNGPEIKVSLKGIATGIYFVELTTEQEDKTIAKILVVK
ncbi:MAG: T9SS type A sorting domain-containing protein [candidate division WOR-3 bacterium]